MAINVAKSSIAKVSLGKNPVSAKGTGPNGKNQTKAQIAKSSQTNSGETKNENGEDVSTDDSGNTPSETTDKIDTAEKARQATIRAIATKDFELKKLEIDTQRLINQDNIAERNRMQEAQLSQANQGVGPALASMGLQTLAALGQAKGGGGSASGGGGRSGSSQGSSGQGTTEEKPHDQKLEEKKPFEDQDKIIRVDSKGNPIKEDSKVDSKKHPEAHTLSQGNSVEQKDSASTFQARPIDHGQMQVTLDEANDYDSSNGMTILSTATDMRSNQSEDINFELAQAEEVQEIEIPEIELEELDEELA